MRTLARGAVVCLLWAAVSFAGEFRGWIAAQSCAEHGNSTPGQHQCEAKCIQDGDTVVFVEESGQVHLVDDEVWAAGYLGRKVVITGAVDEDGLTIEDIQPVEDEASKGGEASAVAGFAPR